MCVAAHYPPPLVVPELPPELLCEGAEGGVDEPPDPLGTLCTGVGWGAGALGAGVVGAGVLVTGACVGTEAVVEGLVAGVTGGVRTTRTRCAARGRRWWTTAGRGRA